MRKGILLTIVSIFIGFIGNAQTLTLLSPQGGGIPNKKSQNKRVILR
jgi:hypothetical protein